MRHLNNGLCRGVFHSRLDTHLFSKRFPLQPSLIYGLLSRILTGRCLEVSDVVGVGECGRLSQYRAHYNIFQLIEYLLILTYLLVDAVATS